MTNYTKAEKHAQIDRNRRQTNKIGETNTHNNNDNKAGQ